MDINVKKILQLIKKSYDQPIIFDILHHHLAHLLKKVTPSYEMVDDWSKILVMSAHPNYLPFQGIEIKIQKFLNENRPPITTKEQKLKIMCICYYLINKPCSSINNIIIFELVRSYLGVISNYFDSLIIKVLNNIALGGLFGQECSKRLKPEYFNKIIEMASSKNISNNNKIKMLPCFINSNIKPFNLNFIEIDNNYLGYKTLEIVCIYAKYTSNTSFIKDILPSDPFFIGELGKFMKNEFSFVEYSDFKISECLMEDTIIYDQLKNAYEMSNDKKKFVVDIVNFVTSFK